MFFKLLVQQPSDEKKLIISCLRREAIKSLALTVNKTDGVIIRFAIKGIGSLFFPTEILSNEAGSFQNNLKFRELTY